MFGFGKKSKKPKRQKAVEFEIVTMESASEDAPQTVILNPEDEKAKKEEKEMLKKQKEDQRAREAEMKKREKEKEEEKRKQIKIEKEKARIREKELRLEKEREEMELKAQKELEERETERKRKEIELKKNEEELEKKQEEIEQKRLEEEIERKRDKQEEELKKQKRLEKQMEKQEKLREKEAKEKARLEKIQLKQQKLKQEQARLEKEVEIQEPSEPQSASPFLTEKEAEQVEQQKTNAKIHEQAYAQALNTQRSEEIKEIAKDELERRQRLFAGRLKGPESAPFEQAQPTTESIMSSDLANKEDNKIEKEIYPEEKEKKGFVKTKTQHKKTSINKTLASVAFLVFLVTLAAGAYYYFFVINAPGEEWTPIEIPEIELPLHKEESETSSDDNNGNDDVSPVIKSNVMKKASLRSINPETFDKDLKKLLSTLKSSPAQSETLKKGMFVKLAKANGQPIETKTLLGLLGIDNQQLLELSKDEIWLFLVKQQQNTLSEEDSVININLVISLSNKQERADLEGSVLLIEQDLPSQCLGLFVDEEKPTIPKKITFQTSATDSETIPQTRFFNYVPGSSKKSVDWSIARYINENYLVISTSKNSTDRLLETIK